MDESHCLLTAENCSLKTGDWLLVTVFLLFCILGTDP